MTSLLASFPSKKSKEQYFISLVSGNGFTPTALETAVRTYSSDIVSYDGDTILNCKNASSFLSSRIGLTRSYLARQQLKDLGKIVQIMTNGYTVFKFRLVQEVNGITTEGVPDNYPTNSFYVCTVSNDPTTLSVNVARTG